MSLVNGWCLLPFLQATLWCHPLQCCSGGYHLCFMSPTFLDYPLTTPTHLPQVFMLFQHTCWTYKLEKIKYSSEQKVNTCNTKPDSISVLKWKFLWAILAWNTNHFLHWGLRRGKKGKHLFKGSIFLTEKMDELFKVFKTNDSSNLCLLPVSVKTLTLSYWKVTDQMNSSYPSHCFKVPSGTPDL